MRSTCLWKWSDIIGVGEQLDLLFFFFTLQYGGEAERLEGIAQALVEFAHEFDPANVGQFKRLVSAFRAVAKERAYEPVQTQCVQEGRQSFHHDQNGNGECRPRREYQIQKYGANEAFGLESLGEHHVPQYLGQFCERKPMCQRFGWGDFITVTYVHVPTTAPTDEGRRPCAKWC